MTLELTILIDDFETNSFEFIILKLTTFDN